MLMLLGVLSLLAGAVLMILGKLWGLLLFLVGFGFMADHSAEMLGGSGRQGDGGFFRVLMGQGRIWSKFEKGKTAQGYEDRPSNIWDQVEGK